jgi:hypothetical protein
LIGEILPRSNFKVADLAGRSVDDLKSIRGTLDAAMPPRVNSARFGVHGADLSDREKGLTVGDVSVVTAAKRKGKVPQELLSRESNRCWRWDRIAVEMEVGAILLKDAAWSSCRLDDVDQTVKEAGAKADGEVGFLEVDGTHKKTDAYAVGGQAPVVFGECLAVLTLLASENVTRGDDLVTAADGKLAKQAVGAMGAQGKVVCQAWESSNVTIDAEILVHWKPSAEPAAAS